MRAQTDLLRRLLAGDIEHRLTVAQRGTGLQQQRGLAYAGITTDQHHRALNQTAAEHAIQLDDAGRLTQLLDHLDDSTHQARAEAVAPTLRVLSTPGFAARWLVPRLSGFEQAQAIRLQIAEGAPSTDFANNDADVVIKWRDEAEDGVDVFPFLNSARYPVASPALLERERITHPHDLLKQTLFRDEVDDQWPEWFRAAGIDAVLPDGDPIYPNCEYASTAAEAGLGISLAYDAVVATSVADGRLVRLFDKTTIPFTIYAIATQSERRNDPLIAGFKDWLISEAGAHAAFDMSEHAAQ